MGSELLRARPVPRPTFFSVHCSFRTNNYTLHAYLADLGLPIIRGDTLIFSWRANNGSGPPIYFEIHSHPITGGYFKYYNTTATSVSNGTWTSQTTDRYMVYWVNLSNTTRVNLTYSFVLLPAQPDVWPLYVVPAVIVLVAIAGAAAHVRARKRPPPWADVGGKDSKETQAAVEAPAPRDQK